MKSEPIDVDLNESSLPASENNLAKKEIPCASAIFEFIKHQKSGVTGDEIFDGVAGRRQHKLRALKHLLLQKEIIPSGSGKRGDPFKYFVQQSNDIPERAQPENVLTDFDKQNAVELFRLLLNIRQRTPKGIGTEKV